MLHFTSRWRRLLLPLVFLVHTTSSVVLRYRARVAYDGSSFQGFQLQPQDRRTVQGCLEEVLSQRFNQPIRLVGAGRTDTGVHARGQAIHFDVVVPQQNEEKEPQKINSNPNLEYSLNRMLPTDVRIWNVSVAPLPALKTIELQDGSHVTRPCAWNVLFDSTRKRYSYRFSLAEVMDPLERHHRWHPDSLKGRPVDLDKLQRLLTLLEGTHDFRAFAGALEANQRKRGRTLSTVRAVYRAVLVDEDNHDNFRIDFLLSGALYKQVRNMVGTAMDASRSVISEEKFRSFLNTNATRSDNKSKPAPPQGLTMEWVYFDNDPESF